MWGYRGGMGRPCPPHCGAVGGTIREGDLGLGVPVPSESESESESLSGSIIRPADAELRCRFRSRFGSEARRVGQEGSARKPPYHEKKEERGERVGMWVCGCVGVGVGVGVEVWVCRGGDVPLRLAQGRADDS